MMKYLKLTLTALIALGTLVGCQDMNEINTDRTRMQTADPAHSLIRSSSRSQATIGTDSMASPST